VPLLTGEMGGSVGGSVGGMQSGSSVSGRTARPARPAHVCMCTATPTPPPTPTFGNGMQRLGLIASPRQINQFKSNCC